MSVPGTFAVSPARRSVPGARPKMENELRAQAPGVVSAVRVRAGEAVEKGQVLVEFE